MIRILFIISTCYFKLVDKHCAIQTRSYKPNIILKVILGKPTSQAGGVSVGLPGAPAITSQSCDLSTLWIPAHIRHLVRCLDSFTLAYLAELACQVGFLIKGAPERTSVAVFCLFLPD